MHILIVSTSPSARSPQPNCLATIRKRSPGFLYLFNILALRFCLVARLLNCGPGYNHISFEILRYGLRTFEPAHRNTYGTHIVPISPTKSFPELENNGLRVICQPRESREFEVLGEFGVTKPQRYAPLSHKLQ
ncbi:hypothetical protein TWF225_010929 [Orbilia oligospora]|nr:hypothetical protein TWF225_010929 [Orbilia oligospora]